MSYGAGHASGVEGTVVPGTLSRHLPFGDWRTQPTADLTDMEFTGHKSNNLGSNDIGLYLLGEIWVVKSTVLSLPDCFGDTVYLKDFSAHGSSHPIYQNEYSPYVGDNPIPIDEFEEFADKVARDLYFHDLTWPGFASGRGGYDTPFYNNGQSPRRTDVPTELWPAEQQVCIETIGCSGRSEINYIAQGMWGAATGEPLPVSEAIVIGWKGWEYWELPSEDTLYWLQYGYNYYQRWLEEQQALEEFEGL